MSLALRFTRECMKPVHATGRMIVATNMSKIIGLVALSILSFETIEGLLIACIRPDIHAHTHTHKRHVDFFSFASHHRHDNGHRNSRRWWRTKVKKKKLSSKVEIQYTECVSACSISVLGIYFGPSLPLSHTHTYTCIHSQIYTPISSIPAFP